MGFMNMFKSKQKEFQIFSPLNGKVLPLAEVKDSVFAEGILGKGVAIYPADGILVSPVNGSVVSVFPTNHALGIQSEDGVDVLIHIGFDTVELEGKYFTGHVSEGDKVSVGDILVEFDLDMIQKSGYDITTPIVISNTNDFESIYGEAGRAIKAGDALIIVK